MKGLIGKKLGMTSIYTEDGAAVPVTVIEAGPCVVTQLKEEGKDGYKAVQLGYGDQKELGPFERFILGGDGLAQNGFLLGTEIVGLRGYQNNSILPSESNGTGGIVYNKYVMELRYLISPNPSATIFVLGFVEGGNNWGSFDEYNPFRLQRSAGFGARIFMPAFGMLGVDWGYGFDEVQGQPGANGAQFHFTIGQQFR